MIGLVAVTAAGRAAAGRLAARWPGQTRCYDGPAAAALPRAWAECDAVVCFLAAGAVIRLIAPLLDAKRSDPAVVCVDEACRFAVALTGGHAAGANALAARAAAALGAQPVITTAADAAGLPGLDALCWPERTAASPGGPSPPLAGPPAGAWPAEGAVAAVSRALLDGEPVALECDQTWPLPALPVTADGTGGHRIVITDRVVPADDRTVVLRPPSLVAGVGASRGVTAAEVLGLLDAALAEAGLSPASVTALATVDAKAAEPGLAEAARRRGVPLRSYPASRLAAVPVPTPGEAALAAVGTPSVAEAAALASADVLIVPKRKSAMATVALARIRPRGRLAVIGLGPGARDLLSPRAVTELRRASVVVGLGQYLDQVRDLLRPGTRVLASGLGAEEARARAALEQARRGHAVALVGSGDAGVYAMASPALAEAGEDIDVAVVPGITAGLAAAALLGAPLGHDHAVISLSDLHTPWQVIERRVRAAAEADLVTVFYNPRSSRRDWQLGAALRLLARHRPPATPAGVVRNAARPGQQVTLTTLAGLDAGAVDMLSIVIVGATATRTVAGRMVTPRGYAWQRR
ncbi:MAG TPA: precorrin-3B C(17)-methyltransferase [Streptosporangiaceae bacterium]|jgi:cobalt-precorrin 5A hydrolase/precorrin-3B C17-methyltransferase|nr:precorrin-3B C(17)-methyltransferase [Streptosporangiaceae bacterium]